MNEFISKIYNSPYFVIGLFILIGILAIIFVLLVFSGKGKKAKKEKNKGNNNLEQNLSTINNASVENQSTTQNSTQVDAAQASVVQDPAISNQNSNEGNNMNINNQPINDNGFNVENNVVNPNPANFAGTPNNEGTAPLVDTPINQNAAADTFNANIFSSVPEDIAPIDNSTPVDNIVVGDNINESIQENNPTNLFEPAPDLSQVSIDVPVSNQNLNDVASIGGTIPNNDIQAPSVDTPITPSGDVPTFDNPINSVNPATDNINVAPTIDSQTSDINSTPIEQSPIEPAPVETTSTPEITVEDTPLGDYQKERIPQQNQFSSVFLNTEPTQSSQPTIETPENNISNSVDNSNVGFNPTPVVDTPDISADSVQPEINSAPAEPTSAPEITQESAISVDLPSANNPVSSEPITPTPEPQTPNIEAVPPLEPIQNMNFNDFDLEKTQTNMGPITNQTQDIKNPFEMPTLANDNVPVSSGIADASADNSTEASNEGGFPNFNNETFNIK